MDKHQLTTTYRRYIDCLNNRRLAALGEFVDDHVIHNDRPVGLPGYREMLERDYRDIPDLHFAIELLTCEPPFVGCRLRFDCHPQGNFLGIPVNGAHVSFTENVFYEFASDKITRVWSVIDKFAIEAQIRRMPEVPHPT